MITHTNHPAQPHDLGLFCHYCHRRLISSKMPPGTAPYYTTDADGAPVLVDDYGLITYDHKLPRSKGGKNGCYNLVPCCRACNNRKDSGDYDDFYESLTAERTARQLAQALDLLRSAAGIVPRQEYQIAGRALYHASAYYRQIVGMR